MACNECDNLLNRERKVLTSYTDIHYKRYNFFLDNELKNHEDREKIRDLLCCSMSYLTKYSDLVTKLFVIINHYQKEEKNT